jgi:hypothetical protein
LVVLPQQAVSGGSRSRVYDQAMAAKETHEDEPVKIPLPPEVALKALLDTPPEDDKSDDGDEPTDEES